MKRVFGHQSSILDVRNVRTRDLLRGLLSRQTGASSGVTFTNLMRSVEFSDITTVDHLIRENPLFAHVQLSAEFPSEAGLFGDGEVLVFSPPPSLRANYIVLRANANAEKIADALAALVRINEAVFRFDDETIIQEFEQVMASHGHSLALARKLAFVLGYRERDTDAWKMAAKAFANYGLNARNFGMMAVADSIGAEFSYLDVKSSFENFADYKHACSISQKVSYLSFKPLSFDYDEVLESVASNYQLSLVDAVMYVLAHRELGVLPPTLIFDERIEEVWESCQLTDFDFELYFGNGPNGDGHAFRAAPAFIEHQRFRDFRLVAQRIYDTPTSRSRQNIAVNERENRFFATVSSVRELLPSQTDAFDPLPTIFDRDTAGVFTRSCALVRIIEADPDFAGLNRDEMGTLMGTTIDVDRLISDSTLRSAVETASDDFVRLILRTLLRAHSPRTKDSYEFKAIFQRYVAQYHGGDVVAFLKAIYALDHAIVPYFIDLLDETLLSQMPFIIRTAESVYETRASLLEWHADYEGGGFARDRAKQLRIDRKIASVRGQINETRLNIDGLRFRHWIDSSKLAEFSGLIRQEVLTLPNGVDVRNKKNVADLKLTAHRDPIARAAVAIMDCYREFCINSNFGVASYLGRRIRHGTLRGTLLNDLPDVAKYDLNLASQAHYERWLEVFTSSIETILSKLHFAVKAGSGRAVISAEIDNKEKWERLLVCLQTVHDNARADHGGSLIPLTIEQFCWYIFEIELRDVQKAVLESRAEFGTYKAKSGSEPNVIRFERDLNIALTDRFNQVASWFKKPPNISPVAQISDIIEIVFRETKAEFPTFMPKMQCALIGDNLELSGAVYYHVYDALSLVIRNAGKHGAHPGALSIRVETEQRDLGEVLRLVITSLVKAEDSAQRAVERMQAAARLGATDADIIEGLSGMRKLEKMKLDNTVYEYGVSADPTRPQYVLVMVAFRLAGIVE